MLGYLPLHIIDNSVSGDSQEVPDIWYAEVKTLLLRSSEI